MTTEHKTFALNLPCLYHKLSVDKCHLAFFGASVTQQGIGYVSGLTALLKSNPTFSHYKFSQLGFGSLHLKDALQLMEEVLLPLHSRNPIHICFLQWFTEPCEVNINSLRTLVVSLLRKNILPAFLLFYNNNNRAERIPIKSLFYDLAREYALPLVDLDSYFEENIDLFHPSIFKDYTHFTPHGSIVVSKLLFDTIFVPYDLNFYPKISRVNTNNITFVPFQRRFVDDYDEVATYLPLLKSTNNPNIPYLAHPVYRNNIIQIPSIPEGIIIGIWTIVGPESGIVRIWSEDSKQEEEKICCWDPWAHYDRFGIKRFSKEWHTCQNLRLQLTDDNPDYSTCRRPVDISKLPPKKLWIIGYSILLGPYMSFTPRTEQVHKGEDNPFHLATPSSIYSPISYPVFPSPSSPSDTLSSPFCSTPSISPHPVVIPSPCIFDSTLTSSASSARLFTSSNYDASSVQVNNNSEPDSFSPIEKEQQCTPNNSPDVISHMLIPPTPPSLAPPSHLEPIFSNNVSPVPPELSLFLPPTPDSHILTHVSHEENTPSPSSHSDTPDAL